jgi:hypothetical protein
MTESPLVPGSVYGLRTWRVEVGDGPERLAGPLQGSAWPAGGWMVARCGVGGEHAAPDRGCECGIHAWHPSRRSARSVMSSRRDMAGIVEAQGAVEVHDDGFRAERARPYAFVLTRSGNAKLVRRLAAAYVARVLELDRSAELAAYCHEHGLGLEEPVVLDLLGREETLARRLARQRQAHANVIKTVATVIAVVIVFLLGLQFAVDPPGDRTLFGRTGEVHVHSGGSGG